MSVPVNCEGCNELITFSEETGDLCPKCGLSLKEHVRKRYNKERERNNATLAIHCQECHQVIETNDKTITCPKCGLSIKDQIHKILLAQDAAFDAEWEVWDLRKGRGWISH